MKGFATTLLEVLLLAALAIGAALGSNALRTDGLKLSKNYFALPRLTEAGNASQRTPPVPSTSYPATTRSAATEPVRLVDRPRVEALKKATSAPVTQPVQPTSATTSEKPAHGLPVLKFEDVQSIVSDALYETGICILVDARKDEAYSAGHIPGALRLNPYEAERFVPEIYPAALGAERIVVYCDGGDCEDSIFAARELIDAGIERSKIHLYEGGMDDWKARGGTIAQEQEGE